MSSSRTSTAAPAASRGRPSRGRGKAPRSDHRVRFAASVDAGSDDCNSGSPGSRKKRRSNPFVAVARSSSSRATFQARVVTVRQLFAAGAGGPLYAAPLFQRRYCWGPQLWLTLFKDIVRMGEELKEREEAGAVDGGAGGEGGAAGESFVGHCLGKVLLDRQTSGQQPAKAKAAPADTRGEAPMPPDHANGDECKTHAGTASTAHSGDRLAGAEEANTGSAPGVALSGRFLCVDGQQRITTLLLALAALRDVARRTAAKCRAVDGVAAAELDTVASECTAALFVAPDGGADTLRWTPTHLDCAPFVAAVRSNDTPPAAIGAGEPIDEAVSRVTRAKEFFMATIARHLHRRSVLASTAQGSATTDASATIAVAELRVVLCGILDGLSVVILELRSGAAQDAFESIARSSEAGHVFFPLHVPRPGRSMASSDLVRNLVMSMLAAEPRRQLRAYKDSWLPLERMVLAAGKGSAYGDATARDKSPGNSDAPGGTADGDTMEPDADVHVSGNRLDAFFMAFLRAKWGVTDLRKVNGIVVLHDDLDVAFPAFAAEFRSRLVRWASERRPVAGGTPVEAGGEPIAEASSVVDIAVDALGGGMAPTALDEYMPGFAEGVIADLLAFAKTWSATTVHVGPSRQHEGSL